MCLVRFCALGFGHADSGDATLAIKYLNFVADHVFIHIDVIFVFCRVAFHDDMLILCMNSVDLFCFAVVCGLVSRDE